ncbi:Thioredoxin [Minicystis rosea]|nr:Thioredoxin [Minicystis rosea]
MSKSASVITANDKSFDELVLGSSQPVLVEMSGTWCGPCKALAPIVAKIAEENVGRYQVVTVDVDESPGVARRYGIRGVPTTLAFAGGAEKGRIVGLTTKERLLGLLRGITRSDEPARDHSRAP